MSTKIWAGVLGAALSFITSIPIDFHRTAGIALYFLIVDSITGVLAARSRTQVTSSAFRAKISQKLGCYAGIIALTTGIGVLVNSWAYPIAGFWAIMAAEGLSIAENIRCLVGAIGPAAAPITKLLDKIVGFLNIDTDSTDATAASKPDESGAASPNVSNDPEGIERKSQ